jgi:hypothetical protein
MMRFLLALLAAWPLAGFAADVLPSHLVGTWGTDPSIDLGTPGKQVMLLRADGYGLILASRPSESGKPGSVDLLGLPARVTLEGNAVTLKPVHPSKSPGILEKQTVFCRHNATMATLDCSSGIGAGGIFQRDNENVSEKMSTLIDKLRQAEEARP